MLRNIGNPDFAALNTNVSKFRNHLTAQKIAHGHAFDKHVLQQGEFSQWIRTRKQFTGHIESVLNDPSTKIRSLKGGRTGYWQQKSWTVVVRNPKVKDGGTAFQPIDDGYNYFKNELKSKMNSKKITTTWNGLWPLCNILGQVNSALYIENFEDTIGCQDKEVDQLIRKINKHEVRESKAHKSISISLNDHEIKIIQNCLKKVLKEIDEWEFQTLIGVSKEEIKKIMSKLENF